MFKKRTTLIATLAATVPLILAACTDNSIFGPSADVAGTYQLTTYSSATPLPARFFFGPNVDRVDMPNGGTWDVTGGRLDLFDDGTFRERDFITKTPTGQQPFLTTDITDGTWGVSGNRLRIETNDGDVFEGTATAFSVRWTEVDPSGERFVFEFER